MRCLSLCVLSLLGLFPLSAQPYINQDVYDYSWDGKTLNPATCETYKRTFERFVVGPPPYPQHSAVIQYAPSPCPYTGLLVEDRVVWTSTAMTAAYAYEYWNGVPIETNYVGAATEVQPQRIREMANYDNMHPDGTGTGPNTRHCYGKTRFWMNSSTNGNYHIKVTFNGGYWDNWFLGYYKPGDFDDFSTPAVKQFSYVADGVKIGGIQCNSAGAVTFYWNPYSGGTIDLTPTVNNSTRNRHWKYALVMEIIP